MGHGIISGKDNVVDVVQGTWHGLGITVDREFTPREGLTLGGLEWGVAQREMYTLDANGTRVLVPSHVANYRIDTDDLLGVVSKNYHVVQNVDMADFCTNLLEEGGGEVRCETVGSILGGRLVWFLLKGEPFKVAKDDEIVPYILVSNGHDGSYSYRVTPTNVRVVCKNTAHMVVPSFDTGTLGSSAIVIRHTQNVMERIEEARHALRHYNETQKANRLAIEAMAKKQVNEAQFQQFFLECYQADFGEVPIASTNRVEENRKNRAVSAYDSFSIRFDDELHLAGATWWNAFNAYSGLIQHDQKARGKDDEARVGRRVESNLFGLSSQRTQAAMGRAFKAALTA